jgi:Ser/Thr protein kinase RdoA (MazF antagonist)
MTLVHGDLHTGNWRSDGGAVTILDWSGTYLGHPADDLVTLVQRLDPPRARVATEAWCAAWRKRVPGCDPDRAITAMRPLVHLEKAVLFQHFLDHIEPSERPYHEGDPAAHVRLALATQTP